MIEEKFKNLIDRSEKLVFHKEDKERIRQNLLNFMRDYTAEPAVPFSFAMFALQTKKVASRYSLLIVAVVALSGIGVSALAQGSLPGELLYPVKTNLNERIAGFVMLSDKAKAEYEINLVKARLEEIEKVAVDNKLNEKISNKAKALLDNHIDNVKTRVEKLKQKGQGHVGIEASSQLEASLNAHLDILSRLSDRKEEKVAAGLKAVVSRVKEKADETIRSRQNDESSLSVEHSAKISVLAEMKMNEADRMITTTSKFIADQKSGISAESYVKAQSDLGIAYDAFAQGNIKYEAGEYQNAFVLFQQALRITQEIRMSITTEGKFKTQLHVPPLQGAPPAEGEGDVQVVK